MKKKKYTTRMQGKSPRTHDRSGVTRRQFIATTAGAGALAGMPTDLFGMGHHQPLKKGRHKTKKTTEQRTYVFNFSHMDTNAHDLILVAGKDSIPLTPVTGLHRAMLRRQHPILKFVPDEHMTHIVTHEMPSEALQMCYVQRKAHGVTNGDWDMAHLFLHFPKSSLHHALRRRRRRAAEKYAQQPPGQGRNTTSRQRWKDLDPRWDTLLPVPVKWAQYGITAEHRSWLSDPVGEDIFKDSNDQASALVSGHPELFSGDADSAAHIQTNIIATQPQTQVLGQIITSQGPATANGGWATQTPLIDEDTGEPYTNVDGDIQYVPVWSDETAQFAGQAITPSLPQAKDDTTLGTNITDVDPETVSDVLADEPVTGAIWSLHDGAPTVDQSDPDALMDYGVFDYQFTNQSPEKGYHVQVYNVDENRNVTIQVKNWYVRYLGLYVRYLDGAGNPIPISSIADTLQSSGSFPLWDLGLNGEYDAFISLINPEWVVYGIPVQTTTIKRTFPMPEQAVSVLFLSGGFGSGDKPYPATMTPGKVMTIVIDFALPALYLFLGVAAALSSLKKNLQLTSTIIWALQVLVLLFQATFLAIEYNSGTAMIRLGVNIGQQLLTSQAKDFMTLVAQSIAEGEAKETVEKAIPVVGNILAAMAAIGLATQLIETSAEVASSPNTYAGKLTFTHDIDVTIRPGNDTVFPATATHYVLTATFDQGTPHTIRRDITGSSTPIPITDTFLAVPYGGQVTVSVGFYSNTDWLAGQGSVGPVANTSSDGPLELEIAITENLVPLRPDTGYSHTELIVLDANGNHEWQQTTTPPAVTTPEGQCESDDGQLCEWTGITVNTANGDVGYAWQAYNSAVGNCTTGAVSQLHQFANISLGANPQSAYFHSGCGFSGTTRVVYDLIGKKDWNFYLDSSSNKNLLRQIRLSGTSPDFDGPDSNLTWGRFHFTSDAMLLHPAGRVISINESLNKIEVVELPNEAVIDTSAPLATVYSGTGIREGLLDGPTLAALDPDGTILILETKNNRIQAFDLGGNPVPKFSEGAYFVPLMDTPTAYLDLAVEYTGYLYVLSYTGQPGSLLYRLDIYTPEGDFLARTTGFNAAKLAVNYWRDIFALNYEILMLPDGSLPERTEPSVSHWIPSTP